MLAVCNLPCFNSALKVFLFMSSFFFYSYGAHRDLHSFPTRRSSDLGFRWDTDLAACFLSQHRYPFEERSEEHTSELQSHSDLVCRLLLEKKKKTDDQVERIDAIACSRRTKDDEISHFYVSSDFDTYC